MRLAVSTKKKMLIPRKPADTMKTDFDSISDVSDSNILPQNTGDATETDIET